MIKKDTDMEKDEYSKAWSEEDTQDGVIENAVEAAAKKAAQESDDEFLTAFKELDKDEKQDA